MAINRTATLLKEQGFDPHHGPMCPYCGHHAILRSASFIYGPQTTHTGRFWVCRNYKDCNSYVGTHKEGEWKDYPLGSMADESLRTARKVAHNIFDLLWKQKHMTRNESYKWMREIIKALPEDCHIGEMDLKMCNMVYIVAMKKLGISEKPMSEILNL